MVTEAVEVKQSTIGVSKASRMMRDHLLQDGVEVLGEADLDSGLAILGLEGKDVGLAKFYGSGTARGFWRIEKDGRGPGVVHILPRKVARARASPTTSSIPDAPSIPTTPAAVVGAAPVVAEELVREDLVVAGPVAPREELLPVARLAVPLSSPQEEFEKLAVSLGVSPKTSGSTASYIAGAWDLGSPSSVWMGLGDVSELTVTQKRRLWRSWCSLAGLQISPALGEHVARTGEVDLPGVGGGQGVQPPKRYMVIGTAISPLEDANDPGGLSWAQCVQLVQLQNARPAASPEGGSSLVGTLVSKLLDNLLEPKSGGGLLNLGNGESISIETYRSLQNDSFRRESLGLVRENLPDFLETMRTVGKDMGAAVRRHGSSPPGPAPSGQVQSDLEPEEPEEIRVQCQRCHSQLVLTPEEAKAGWKCPIRSCGAQHLPSNSMVATLAPSGPAVGSAEWLKGAGVDGQAWRRS